MAPHVQSDDLINRSELEDILLHHFKANKSSGLSVMPL